MKYNRNPKYHPRRKNDRSYQEKHRAFKPGADRGLKKLFARIGVPDEKPFQPDPFQLAAVEAIKEGDCLVTAPTGAGKTWIAIQAIAHILQQGGSIWYASPLKALTNAKYAEFSHIFGRDKVGILTGDRKEHAGADIITGTTEILRNQLYDAMYLGEDLKTDFVILDEAHFLGDEERGVVWEEIMIYLPDRIPLLMLSATVGNAEQISGWLESIRSRKCIIVAETKRPVPLYPLFLHPSGTLTPLMMKNKDGTKLKLHTKVSAVIEKRSGFFKSGDRKAPLMVEMLRTLQTYNLLPAIFFMKSRADCDKALELCAEFTIEDESHRKKLAARFQELAGQSPHIAKHRQRNYLQSLGLGSHHSGQLPAWKLVLETLMTQGLMNAVFATSTVAAGVNFPARTILFFNSDRFNGREFMPLSPTEFHQMTGRAGRRGMDKIGFAIAVPGKYMDLQAIGKLVSAPPSDVISRIRINFSMTLNLLLSHTMDRIKALLYKSFAAYLKMRTNPAAWKSARSAALWNDFKRHVTFLQETGYVTPENTLSPDGVWASKLRVDHPLLIAESLKLGLLPDSNPLLMAGIMASFVYDNDSDEKFVEEKLLYHNVFQAMQHVKNGIRSFAFFTIDSGFELRPLFLRPALAVYSWARGDKWEQAVAVSKIPEGNLAMLVLRTADNLRHIKLLYEVFPNAAKTAQLAIDLLLRDPVSAFFEELPDQN